LNLINILTQKGLELFSALNPVNGI